MQMLNFKFLEYYVTLKIEVSTLWSYAFYLKFELNDILVLLFLEM